MRSIEFLCKDETSKSLDFATFDMKNEANGFDYAKYSTK